MIRHASKACCTLVAILGAAVLVRTPSLEAYINGGFSSAQQERDYYAGKIPHPIDKTYYRKPVPVPVVGPSYKGVTPHTEQEREVLGDRLAMLRKCVESARNFPKDPYPACLASKLHYLLGDYADALTDADVALKRDLRFGRAYLRRALARAKLRQSAEVVAGDLKRSLELDPDYFPTHLHAVLLKKPTEAQLKELTATAERLNSKNLAYYEVLAYGYSQTEKPALAIETQKKAIELLPEARKSNPLDRAFQRLRFYQRTDGKTQPPAFPEFHLEEIEGSSEARK